MNKQETIIVVLLFGALILWMTRQPGRQPSHPQETPEKEAVERTTQNTPAEPSGPDHSIGEVKTTTEPVQEVPVPTNTTPVVTRKLEPAVTKSIGTDDMKVWLSSRGATVTSVELCSYESSVTNTTPVILDFSDKPSLSLSGIEGFSTNSDFTLLADPKGKWIRASETNSAGVVLERTVRMGDSYRLEVTDVFRNAGNVPVVVGPVDVSVGSMKQIATRSRRGRFSMNLGVDTFNPSGGFDVIYWGKKGPKNDRKSLAARFKTAESGGGGCGPMRRPMLKPLPESVTIEKEDMEVEWLAAKNRFFVQILAPESGGTGFTVEGKRVVPPREDPGDRRTWSSMAALSQVSGKIRLQDRLIQPGESISQRMFYYVGPKKFDVLEKLGKEQDKVMFRAWPGWGWFRVICIWLLKSLNLIEKGVHNYGVAIILLTIIVKILFWPFTHKSTESMRKMQKIQPLIQDLREKYKKDPQKLQKETMLLYREHKVNPFASCLPMFFQMPIFIALFIMLRSSVELRFESFLWIRDLTEPEGLFPGIPIIGTLNILPLLMTATMVLQQKLTPTAGDAQQQKTMMIIMPIFMLWIMYNMPSALTLYWTVSQGLSIVQLVLQRRQDEQS